VATVELAIMMPLLLLLLASIIELGLMTTDRRVLHQAAREGVWRAASGATISDIEAHVATSAEGIDATAITVTCERAVYHADTETWGAWSALGDSGSGNDAYNGDWVRVTLNYPHEFVTGGVFPALMGDPGATSVTMSCSVTARRE
jgi:Flp pilus assembly protein TadG